MHHKRSKSKGNVSPRSVPKKCRLCQVSGKSKHVCLLQFLQLNKKYLQNDVKAGMSCKYDNFVSGKLRTYQGGVTEFQKEHEYLPTLQKLYSWSEVVENITSVIQNRTKVDKFQPIHFSYDYYYLMLRFYHKKRDINRFKTKGKNSEDIGKSTQPGDIKLIKNSKSHKKLKSPRMKSVKKGIRNKNQSFLEMEKLTNNIEKMYNKMSDKKILDNFSKELKIKQTFAGNQANLNFMEKQIEQKISFIKMAQHPKKKKKKCNSIVADEDLYGLKRSNISSDKQKKKPKYNSKRVTTETITDKIQPLTPVSQKYYAPGEYFCTQKYSDIGDNDKQYKFFKRKVKGSESRSKKSLSRNSSKKKQGLKVNKLTKAISQTKLK